MTMLCHLKTPKNLLLLMPHNIWLCLLSQSNSTFYANDKQVYEPHNFLQKIISMCYSACFATYTRSDRLECKCTTTWLIFGPILLTEIRCINIEMMIWIIYSIHIITRYDKWSAPNVYYGFTANEFSAWMSNGTPRLVVDIIVQPCLGNI